MNPGRYASCAAGLLLLLVVAMAALIGVGVGGPGPSGNLARGDLAQNPLPTALDPAPGSGTPAQASRIPATPAVAPTTSSVSSPGATAQQTSLEPTPAEPPALPLPASTPSVEMSAEPTPDPSPGGEVEVGDCQGDRCAVFGVSAQGRSLVAHRLGSGPIKVVLVGDIHGAYESNTYFLVEELFDHFASHPDEIPGRVSLWLIPTLNPDGLAAGTRWNANGVDLNRNADTDLDGCAGNDWSPDTVGSEGNYPGAGGPYPFSEPESQALRGLVADAQVVVFYHSAAGAIYADSCRRHLPSARLAQALSEGTGYPVPADGWTGYRITGDFGDYLAGEGVASVTVELTDHEGLELERNLEGVRSLLAEVDQVVAADAEEAGAELVWLDDGVCALSLEGMSLAHPLAAEVVSDTLYLLDSGRVLALDLGSLGVESLCSGGGERVAPAPEVLLTPGDSVAGVYVTEPLDLATTAASSASPASLFVLDRAGDVYRMDMPERLWTLERYGRPSIDTGDHYYVALSAAEQDRFLLETTREKVWRFTQSQKGAAWASLPLGRDVDVSATKESVYVLTRALGTPAGDLVRYRRTSPEKAQEVASFEPEIPLVKPRQVVATQGGVFVLDRAGRRLLKLDPARGALEAEYRFSDGRAVSAFWANPIPAGDGANPSLILAGRGVLYFFGYPMDARPRPGAPGPAAEGSVQEGGREEGVQPNNPGWLDSLRGLAMPIDGATITRRDYQMPGSPRHYRLGVHEGIDFYTATSGVPIDNSTPVRAVAAGKVIRALLDYRPLTAAQARAWAKEVGDRGYTPADVLDGYRGRQVWIEHENGLISRYCHLSAISPGIVAGTLVEQGQVIGMVGNSGTPESVSNPKGELHLHLELWAGEHYVGQFLRPIEVREWIEGILR